MDMSVKMKVLGNHEGCLGVVKQMASGKAYCTKCRAMSPVVVDGAAVMKKMFALPKDEETAALVALVNKAVRQ